MFKIFIPFRSAFKGIVQQPFSLKNCRFYKSIMSAKCFEGQLDRYNGVIVDSTKEPCESDVFSSRLKVSLNRWLEENRRTIWFRVNLAQAGWIPVLAIEGFKFHHAKEEYVTLYRWLPKDQTANIPPYAHTNLGVGAFVLNEKTNEILVIKEKYIKTPMWKLPGGYVEPGENISDAAEREVLEETGVKAKFKCLVSFRHGHQYAFGCSDIYMIACLTPLSFEINKCDREISECSWMKVEQYADHPLVHDNNRFFAKKMLEHFNHRMGIGLNNAIHPITKNPICVYSIENVDS